MENRGNTRKKQVKSNQSVEKLLKIIEELAYARQTMRLQDLSERLSLSPATALRFLSTLIENGYVFQDAQTLKYGLTMKLCGIADQISAAHSVREVARPFLRELSDRCGESVCLAINEDSSAVYIDVVNAAGQMLTAMQRIGKRAPLYCTGVGKLFLLEWEPDLVARYLAGANPERFTANTITTAEALQHELASVRQAGVAYDNEECEIGAKCIAAPIRDYTGKIVAAISITGPLVRITPEFVEKFRPVLVEYGEQISHRLGYLGE